MPLHAVNPELLCFGSNDFYLVEHHSPSLYVWGTLFNISHELQEMMLEGTPNLALTSWLIVLAVCVISWMLFTKRPKNYPPSPGLALPVVGHFYLLDKNPRLKFKRWARELGPVFSIQMGSVPFVVINGYDLIKEALVNHRDFFSERATSDMRCQEIPQILNGLAISSGSVWKEQRTITLSILGNLGMGKNVLAERISAEVSCYIEELMKTKGEPKDIKNLTNACVANVIFSMLRGSRYSLDDPKFVRHLHRSSDALHLYSSASVLNFVPFLQYIPFDPFRAKKLLTVTRDIMKFSLSMVEEIKATYDPDNLNNFIVSYLHEMKKKKDSAEPTELSERNLASCIDDLSVAGTETTSSTISWCLLYALHFPEKQEKAYQEIFEEVGANRTPTLLDKPKLNYLNAYIMESQRLASIVPLNAPRQCTGDVELGGYFIPKGTQIIPSLDSVLHDEKIWGDPQNFRPERFLDAQGNLISDEHFIPFSLGRRVCLGEPLAKMELFLFMSALFQRFKFLPKDANEIPPLNDLFGITAPPVNFEIRCVDRND